MSQACLRLVMRKDRAWRKGRAWLLALAGWAAMACAQAVLRFDEVKASYRSSDTVLLDRHGAPLHAMRTDASALRGEWVSLAQVSPAMRHALLLSEDKRFYQHAGVDWQAVGAAAWANLWNSRTRGASTVTMQLAGLLDGQWAGPKNGQGGRSWSTKLGQAATAWQLERQWRKDQILEAYLNLVGFRGELVGISALSARLFHKYPSGLNAEEAAIAAALVRAPNARADRVAARACDVLTEQGLAAQCSTLRAHVAQVLASKQTERLDADAQLAPHLARQLLNPMLNTPPGAGKPQPLPATLVTTVDAGVQRWARDTLRQHLMQLRDRHVEDGAVIVLDNASGDVLAWVGSSGHLSQAAQVDGVSALRQAGSTLKPFLYEMALAQRWLTAASLLDDSPVGLTTGSGLYIPQNYDRQFKGLVSLRTTLGSSLNIPAVRTLVMVTPTRFAQRLQALGLPLKHQGDHYGYSLALGSAEVTLASLSNAYRALANGGVVSPLRMRASDPPSPSPLPSSKQVPRPVMDPAASFIVADVLADREARVPTFGLDNALATRYWSAVKTGTSKDMRDNWCVGFSRRFTVGVWVGNASGEPMWDVSGVTGAAPVWRAVMDELHQRYPAQGLQAPPQAPAGVVQQPVQFERNLEPMRQEWFITGTAQPYMQLASRQGATRTWIQSPADRTVVALDPDIPPQAQKLQFAVVQGVPRNWRWCLDGQGLGPAVNKPWSPWPGGHTLELLDASGKAVESVRFEVRGAQVRSGGQSRPAKAVQFTGARMDKPTQGSGR